MHTNMYLKSVSVRATHTPQLSLAFTVNVKTHLSHRTRTPATLPFTGYPIAYASLGISGLERGVYHFAGPVILGGLYEFKSPTMSQGHRETNPYCVNTKSPYMLFHW